MEKRKTHKQHSNKDSFACLIKNSGIGCAAAMVCAAISLFAGGALCYMTADPNKYVLAAGMVAIYLSAMLGGLIASRLQGGDALLCGGICGTLFMLVFLFFTLFFDKQSGDLFSTGISLILRAMTVVASILGALIGARRKKAPRRRKK